MRKILPVLLILVGLVLVAVSVVQGVGGVTSSLQSVGQSWTAPGEVRQELTAGPYMVYEEGSRPSLDAADIAVTGPTGELQVSNALSSTLTLGTTTYVGIASFTADRDGAYTVTAIGDGQTLVIGPSVLSTVGGAFVWLGVGALGGLLALAGVVWLIAALIVGGRSRQQAAVGLQHPAPVTTGAWYPDPEDPSQWRWWDGQQWTDYRQPR